MRGEAFGGPMLGIFLHQLDLSDGQRTQLKDIMTKEKPALKPLMQQMAQGEYQLRDLVMSGNFGEEQAREMAGQQSQIMTELMVQHARIESEMIQVLTPGAENETDPADTGTRRLIRKQGKSQNQGRAP